MTAPNEIPQLLTTLRAALATLARNLALARDALSEIDDAAENLGTLLYKLDELQAGGSSIQRIQQVYDAAQEASADFDYLARALAEAESVADLLAIELENS
jgi:hypothetical protein